MKKKRDCTVRQQQQQHLCGPVAFGKSGRKTASWTHRSDKLRAEEEREEGWILLCRGSLHYSQPSLLVMGFICGPNKVQQNILCSRRQSGLLWLVMKIKNVSEGVLCKRRWEKCRINRFVTVSSDEESKGKMLWFWVKKKKEKKRLIFRSIVHWPAVDNRHKVLCCSLNLLSEPRQPD